MLSCNSKNADAIIKKQFVYQKQSKDILEDTLKLSGLILSQQIDYRAVLIYEYDHMHQIYTVNQTKNNLPHLVLLHGFGGTSMAYFKMFKYLRAHYQVHALDNMGVGHSSKGNFKGTFTYEESRNYYVDAIQQWRIALNIQKFSLVGHSFGGYLATCYTEDHPQRVDRLVLLSPAGATEKSDKQIEEELQNRYKRSGLGGKVFHYIAEKVFKFRIRPTKAMGVFYFGNKLINKVVDTRLQLQKQQSEQWKIYFKDLSKKESVGQTGFYILFEWPLKTKHTIQSMIKRMELQIQVQFYYGLYDWMDSIGGQRLAYQLKNVTFDRIGGAGHQLIFNNPQQICQFIIKRKAQ